MKETQEGAVQKIAALVSELQERQPEDRSRQLLCAIRRMKRMLKVADPENGDLGSAV